MNNKLTPFELAVLQAAEGKLQTPTVCTSEGQLDYFGYQLAVHKYNLRIMAAGMLCRDVKLKDLKHYYGLKGRTAKECLEQFETIVNNYKASI